MSIEVHIVTHHVIEVENHDDIFAAVADHMEFVRERPTTRSSAAHIGELPTELEAGFKIELGLDGEPGPDAQKVAWGGYDNDSGGAVGLDRGEVIALVTQGIQAAEEMGK